MAHLYLDPETDSLYLDVTTGDRSPVDMAEAARGVILHVDEGRALVAIEVMGLSQRGGSEADDPERGHMHINSDADSFYLDVSSGTRPAAKTAAIGEGVLVHTDEAGELVAIEVTGLGSRGGLHMGGLDAPPGTPRPAIFDKIERAAAGVQRRG